MDEAEWALSNWLIPTADSVLFSGVENSYIHRSIPLPPTPTAPQRRLRSPDGITENAKHRTPSESGEAIETSLPSCNPA